MHSYGQGFAPEAGEVVSGSNNVQNARPDLDYIIACRKNTTGLWPVQEAEHPLAFPAIKGELAFTIKTYDSASIYETVNQRRCSSSKIPGMASFSDTRDTVFYLTVLNGVGSQSQMDEFRELGTGIHSRGKEDKKTASQRSYRNRIQFLGFVHDTVLKDHNLVDQGNTIVVSKGKITIPNSGPKPILQGMQISWDVPVEKDYHKYGLNKWKISEPNRYSLLTVPTNTGDAAIEETVESLMDEFRSPTHMEFSKRLWKGILAVSSGMDAQMWGTARGGKLTSYLKVPQKDLDGAEPSIIRQPGQRSYPPAFDDLEDFIKTKAILSLDEDTIDESNGATAPAFGLSNANLYVANAEDRKAGLEYLMKARFPDDSKIKRFDKPKTKIFKHLVEHGLYDIVVGLNGLIVSSQDRFIGIAATDSAPGNKFDIIL